jgi:ABC-type branched-subunit amino acid transport system permease subunit
MIQIQRLAGILRTVNPYALGALLLVAVAFPFFSDQTTIGIIFFALIFAASATSWNIFAGYTGYIALGHAVYYGVGAYALAIICQNNNIPGGWQPLYLVPLCGLIAGVVAVPLGAIALRTRRHTFVVVTIATFFVMQLLAYNLRGLTHGTAGIDMPLPFQWFPPQLGLPQSGFFNLVFYYAALALTLVALAVSWFVRHSKYGLGLLAIRDDEDRARSLGVNTEAFKLSAFVLSAIFVGMAGAIATYYVGSVQPTFAFDALFDVEVALMVFMGGIGTLSGPILGALVIIYAKQYLAADVTQLNGGLYLILFGALFLAVILLLPQGVIPTLRSLWQRWQARQQATPASAAPPPATETVKREEVRA